MTGEDYFEVKKLIAPGDVLLCRSGGEFTNHFIPGFWTHAAIYAGQDIIVEAVSPHVREKYLIDFLISKDFVAVLRPVFADEAQRLLAIEYARKQAQDKVAYDYDFEPNESAFYCAELVGQAYIVAMGGASPFVLKETLGVLTFVPDDFYKARDKFKLVWVKNDSKIPGR